LTGRGLVLVVAGQKKALRVAVRNDQSRKRYSGLLNSLMKSAPDRNNQKQ